MTHLNITQEQYDEAIRGAKAQTLREAADRLADIDFEPEDANTPADVGVIAAAKDLRKWADEMETK